MPPREPTPRQLQAIAALLATPGYKCASEALGLSPRTVRNHLTALRRRLGVDTNEQAVYILTARGVLVVPGIGRRAA